MHFNGQAVRIPLLQHCTSACGIVLTILLIGSCQNELSEIEQFVETEQINEEMSDVVILYSDSANVQVRIEGDKLVRPVNSDAQTVEFTEGVLVTFFDKQGGQVSTMTADYAIQYTDENRVVAKQNVVWKSIEKHTLETEELIWEQTSQRIYSNAFTTITQPGRVIYGYGFETSDDFSEWIIRSVEGELSVQE